MGGSHNDFISPPPTNLWAARSKERSHHLFGMDH